MRLPQGLAYDKRRRVRQAIVNLIATDERIYNYRHPLPTDKKLDKYAMVVLCGRKQGAGLPVTRRFTLAPSPPISSARWRPWRKLTPPSSTPHARGNPG